MSQTTLLYKAFEVAMCMVEELHDRGVKASSVTAGEALLNQAPNTLARDPARFEFKHFSLRQRKRGYELARGLADWLLEHS